MIDRIKQFWAALGALSFEETLNVSQTMRDAWECAHEFEPTDARDWAFLLNTAREIAQDRQEA